MSNPNSFEAPQSDMLEQTDLPEEGTSWENPGKFPEFMSGVKKLPKETQIEDNQNVDNWDDDWGNDDDWGVNADLGDNGWGDDEPLIEETPEQKAKREAESAERERQRRIQMELDRWDDDDALAEFKADNLTASASIRNYISRGKLASSDMHLLINSRKEDVVRWFADEQYSEALPKMIQEFGSTATSLGWGLNKSPQEMIKLASELEKLDEIEIANEDEKRAVEDLRSIYKNEYDENLCTPEVADSFFDLTSYVVKNHISRYTLSPQVIDGFMIRARSPEELATCLQATKELSESGDIDKIDILADYQFAHDFDKSKLKAFQENVIPMMKQDDPEVSILNRKDSTGGTAFALHYGQYGAADYAISALTSKITPSNINELLCAEREIPTNDANKFERNRLDALELQGVLYRAREFIHDNMPGVHELLSAMLDYYDSRNEEQTHAEKTAELQRVVDDRMNGKYSEIYRDLDKYVFDFSNYEQKVKKRTERYGKDESSTEVSSDVLRRLVENTADNVLEKPKTTDKELNRLLENLDIREDKNTGEIHVDWEQTGELVKYVNNYLIQHQGDVGIRPSMISTVSYAEKMATHAMKNISDKDWHELPFDPEFKEFVRLQELIGSDGSYSERRFNGFYDGLIREMSKNFESDNVARETYGKLQQHVLQNLRGLAAKYNSNPYTSHRAGSLWSGNLAHELIGLAAK